MAALPEVRIAVPDDEPAIMAMCRRLHEENGMLNLNEEKVQSNIRKCFAREGTIIGVIGEIGRLQGSTCLAISTMHYTDDWHLEEHWNFVEKEHRKSRNAEALIEFGKACAEKMGIPLLTGIITNKQMAGKVRLYRRLLGYPAGAYFVYNSRWPSEPMEDHRDLYRRLRKWAQTCNDTEVPAEKVRKELGPLLREAAQAVSSEDNLWGVARPGVH